MSVTKRSVLDMLTKQRLIELANGFDIAVGVNRPKGDFVDALVRARRVSVRDVLEVFGRDELKAICRGLGLDDTGRSKQELVDRMVGGDENTDESDSDSGRTGGPACPPTDQAESVQPQEIAPADESTPTFTLTMPEPEMKPEVRRRLEPGPAAKRKSASDQTEVLSYRHLDLRMNNPQVGLVNDQNDPYLPKTQWAYDPHIDPSLQFDVGRAEVEKLIDEALESGDEAVMRAALEELKRASALPVL